MENENQLVYVDDEGNEILCEIVFTFDSDHFKKSYVLFFPIGEEDEGNVYAMSYEPLEDGSIGELSEIETDEEWDLIEETLASFEDEECGDCEDCDHDHEE